MISKQCILRQAFLKAFKLLVKLWRYYNSMPFRNSSLNDKNDVSSLDTFKQVNI